VSGAATKLRSVLLGVALGVAPLLLLDLARQLSRVTEATSAWWAIASYALIGALGAIAVLQARRDPLVPAVAAVVLLLAVAPALPAPFSALPMLPVVGDAAVGQRPLLVVLVAACAVGAVRGRSA
jgi:hypothetical protein